MFRKMVLPLCLVAAMATGCDDDGTDDTAGDGGGTTGDAHVALGDATVDATTSGGDAGDGGRGLLQSGTYNVTGTVTKISDGCLLVLEDGTFTSTELTNTGNDLSIGKKYDSTTDPKWVPEGYGLGTGPYTSKTTATLTVTAHVSTDGCEFDTTRTSNVTFTGDNNVTVDYTDSESNQTSGCTAALGFPTTACTSHYTFNLTKAP